MHIALLECVIIEGFVYLYLCLNIIVLNNQLRILLSGWRGTTIVPTRVPITMYGPFFTNTYYSPTFAQPNYTSYPTLQMHSAYEPYPSIPETRLKHLLKPTKLSQRGNLTADILDAVLNQNGSIESPESDQSVTEFRQSDESGTEATPSKGKISQADSSANSVDSGKADGRRTGAADNLESDSEVTPIKDKISQVETEESPSKSKISQADSSVNSDDSSKADGLRTGAADTLESDSEVTPIKDKISQVETEESPSESKISQADSSVNSDDSSKADARRTGAAETLKSLGDVSQDYEPKVNTSVFVAAKADAYPSGKALDDDLDETSKLLFGEKWTDDAEDDKNQTDGSNSGELIND